MKPEIAYLVNEAPAFEDEEEWVFYPEGKKPSSYYKKVKRIVYWEIGNED
jgi:hypothetical protein